jgi:hypothetical protein
VGTVLLLPAGDPEHAALRAALAAAVGGSLLIEPVAGPDSAYATRVCAALPQQGMREPAVVIAFGEQAGLLPAVARALRTRRVSVGEYVLVEPLPPPVTDTWPDAPVRVFADRPDPVLALRGWTVDPLGHAVTWRPAGPDGRLVEAD